VRGVPATSVPAATAAPAKPPCASGDEAAAVLEEPTAPPIAAAARALDVSGTAAIEVQLDSGGAVTGAAISQSTGDPTFDALAVGMARDAKYSPARHACKAVASTYLFRVQFYAW
jgi:TonB family protein